MALMNIPLWNNLQIKVIFIIIKYKVYIDLVLNLKIKIQYVPDDDSLDVELAPELSYVVSSEPGP